MTVYDDIAHNAIVIYDKESHMRDVVKHISPFSSIVSCEIGKVLSLSVRKYCICIICVDINDRNVSSIIEELVVRANNRGVSTLFVLDESLRRDAGSIFSMGGTGYIIRPLSPQKLNLMIGEYVNRFIEKSWTKMSDIQSSALKASLKSFNNMMLNAAQRMAPDFSGIQASCRQVIQVTQVDGLEAWISALRGHHNRTFSHSMQTCAYLVEFAHEIGISGEDLENLAIAGVVHDIGKIHVPQHILDKPGRLNRAEFNVVKRHPFIGYQILRQNEEFDAVILDAALHHHERLDGSGYPDGLRGGQISNVAALAAIADVFSALTEKRPYKEELSNEEAYDLMLGMVQHLDASLVRSFEPIAIRRKSLAA